MESGWQPWAGRLVEEDGRVQVLDAGGKELEEGRRLPASERGFRQRDMEAEPGFSAEALLSGGNCAAAVVELAAAAVVVVVVVAAVAAVVVAVVDVAAAAVVVIGLTLNDYLVYWLLCWPMILQVGPFQDLAFGCLVLHSSLPYGGLHQVEVHGLASQEVPGNLFQECPGCWADPGAHLAPYLHEVGPASWGSCWAFQVHLVDVGYQTPDWWEGLDQAS